MATTMMTPAAIAAAAATAMPVAAVGAEAPPAAEIENPEVVMMPTDETHAIPLQLVSRRRALLGSLALLALGACRHTPAPIIRDGDHGDEDLPWWKRPGSSPPGEDHGDDDDDAGGDSGSSGDDDAGGGGGGGGPEGGHQ